jgi:geranylgeranyl diphosphate synthase, type II
MKCGECALAPSAGRFGSLPDKQEMGLSRDVRQSLYSHCSLIEERLPRLLPSAGQCASGLLEAMRYSLLAPGKRLRPLLVLLANEASGGDIENAVVAGCAVEMVHTYSLIHDDLPAMDDDDLRRGQPTCHKKFGEATAILAGDALSTLAFDVLATHYPPATAAACCRELARGAGACGMVGGQADDLAWERAWEHGESSAHAAAPAAATATLAPPAATSAALEKIHAQKTGALFRACLRLGVYTAQGERPGGPEPDLLKALDGYGRYFGQVFQITDDLIDVEGNAADTGKRVHKDAERGKLTYPGLLGIEESRRRARLLTEEAGRLLSPLGDRGQPLRLLLETILQRDR